MRNRQGYFTIYLLAPNKRKKTAVPDVCYSLKFDLIIGDFAQLSGIFYALALFFVYLTIVFIVGMVYNSRR